jgi:MraZ protein
LILGFSGKFVHAINANGRVSIPSKFRDNLKAICSDDRIVLRKLETADCVQAYPVDAWREIFNSLPKKTESDRLAKRRVSANSQEVEIDNNGRILLPPEFRERFSSECLFLGMGDDHFEIWNMNAWDDLNKKEINKDKLSPEYEEFEL